MCDLIWRSCFVCQQQLGIPLAAYGCYQPTEDGGIGTYFCLPLDGSACCQPCCPPHEQFNISSGLCDHHFIELMAQAKARKEVKTCLTRKNLTG